MSGDGRPARAKQAVSLKARALRYLSAREHSRSELAAKLRRHAGEGDDPDALLAWLAEQGFLSDERFAGSLVRRRAGRYGNSRIRQELRRHRVDGVLPEADISALLGSEALRAAEVRGKKFGDVPSDARERARQMRFLQQRGFGSDAIRKAMKGEVDEYS